MPATTKPAAIQDVSKGSAGLPVDAYGGQTVDPTKNVLDLVAAAVKRHDDLRDSDNKHNEEMRAAETQRTNDLRAAETRRTDDLRKAEQRRVDEESNLRAEYSKLLTEAEAKRIDAIRAVDVNAVSVASSRASDQATVLANQVVASADTLRNLVATNASALASQLTQIITPITDRLALLEKSNYEGAGRAVVNSPMMDQLREEVSKLRAERNETSGKSQGVNSTITMIVVIGGLLIGLITLAFKLKP